MTENLRKGSIPLCFFGPLVVSYHATTASSPLGKFFVGDMDLLHSHLRILWRTGYNSHPDAKMSLQNVSRLISAYVKALWAFRVSMNHQKHESERSEQIRKQWESILDRLLPHWPGSSFNNQLGGHHLATVPNRVSQSILYVWKVAEFPSSWSCFTMWDLQQVDQGIFALQLTYTPWRTSEDTIHQHKDWVQMPGYFIREVKT